MIRKQLITLAAVLGILAMGACFAPTPYEGPAQRQPPPLELQNLNGIHMMNVMVENDSPGKHIDKTDFSYAIVNAFNSPNKIQNYMDVHATTGDAEQDAKLAIVILDEEVTPIKSCAARRIPCWQYKTQYEATLTARGGRVIWEKKDIDVSDVYFVEKDAVMAGKGGDYAEWGKKSMEAMMKRSSFWIVNHLFVGQP